MQLERPFLKLPVRFDPGVLSAEVRALPREAWLPHPQGFPGNEGVPLVTPGGEITDEIAGQMRPTPYLARCPYIMEVMGTLGAVWGRSRLMALGPGGQVPPHVDINYYWQTHLRIHVPVITNPQVRFTCDDQTVHMEAGDCWVFDTFRRHMVHNEGSEQRVHLVLDTVGGEHLAELMDAARQSDSADLTQPGAGIGKALQFENINFPLVMSPWELRSHIELIRDQTIPDPLLPRVWDRLGRLATAWTAAWARFGTGDEGLPAYQELLRSARADVHAVGAAHVRLTNDQLLYHLLDSLVFMVGVANDRVKDSILRAGKVERQLGSPSRTRSCTEVIDRPIFVVSTPRSGSTLLFETLEHAPGLFTTKRESHQRIEAIGNLSPAKRGWLSNRLTEKDATPEIVEELTRSFYGDLIDRNGRVATGAVRMLEKTPKNALRVPFFDAAFPDAEFVYLYRDVRQTLASMMEAWATGRFRTYPQLPGWQGMPWSLLLVPGWRDLAGKPLPIVVAQQWATTTELLLDDLEALPPQRVRCVDYDALIADPLPVVEPLAKSLGLEWDKALGPTLPLSNATVSLPDSGKWKRVENLIESVWPIVEAADTRARNFLKRDLCGDSSRPRPAA